MQKELTPPPCNEIDWTITRRDGLIATRKARTAWLAASMLGWAFMDCIEFNRGPDVC